MACSPRSEGFPTRAGQSEPSPPMISPVKVIGLPAVRSGTTARPKVLSDLPSMPETGVEMYRLHLHLLAKGLHTGFDQVPQSFKPDQATGSSRIDDEPSSLFSSDHEVVHSLIVVEGKAERIVLMFFDGLVGCLGLFSAGSGTSGKTRNAHEVLRSRRGSNVELLCL